MGTVPVVNAGPAPLGTRRLRDIDQRLRTSPRSQAVEYCRHFLSSPALVV